MVHHKSLQLCISTINLVSMYLYKIYPSRTDFLLPLYALMVLTSHVSSCMSSSTVLEYAKPSVQMTSKTEAVFSAAGRFLVMFFGSAAIGVVCGLISALVSFDEILKYSLACSTE